MRPKAAKSSLSVPRDEGAFKTIIGLSRQRDFPTTAGNSRQILAAGRFWRPSSRVGGQLGQHLLGDAMGIDRGRVAAIDRHLPQNGGEFLFGDAVAQGAAEMRLELVH